MLCDVLSEFYQIPREKSLHDLDYVKDSIVERLRACTDFTNINDHYVRGDILSINGRLHISRGPTILTVIFKYPANVPTEDLDVVRKVLKESGLTNVV